MRLLLSAFITFAILVTGMPSFASAAIEAHHACEESSTGTAVVSYGSLDTEHADCPVHCVSHHCHSVSIGALDQTPLWNLDTSRTWIAARDRLNPRPALSKVDRPPIV